ncbi:hypothetical protein D9V34_02240 [Mycetocola lacteus]|uniref:Multidrug ABC transporter ATPase n=1 Tax=Mycetocola lacteus TaxID=76637 RepID=A0A3L7AVW4_9MICO|nr:hypothetical protein [Mycetocola lacteus]RLP83658.1 hypothetical protein D9V34_02240 [Mycetocola lacteus]
MTIEEPRSVSRTERVLAYLLLVFVAAAIISFFAIIIGSSNGMTPESFDTPLWRVIAFVPWVGLPAAFIIVFVLIFIGSRGRAAANEKAVRSENGS